MRDLDQDARAVAGFRIAAARAAMGQIDEDLHALLNDVVRLLPFDVGDKADTASIMLVCRVVQTLRGRRAGRMSVVVHGCCNPFAYTTAVARTGCGKGSIAGLNNINAN